MLTTNSIKIANKLFRAGKLESARKEYEKLIELNPNLAWNYYYLGQLLVAEKKLPDAVTQYQNAIELNPNSATFYHSLAEALIQQGKLNDGINYLQKAISLQSSVAIYQTLALAYEAKSDLRSAWEIWQKIIIINPSHMRATKKVCGLQVDIAKDCINQGDKLSKEGNIKESVEYYQQGLIFNPQQPMSVYRTCGNNLITLGKFGEAEKVFQELKELYPELPEGYHGYAKVAHSYANWELALKRWQEAIAKFPENMGFQLEKGNVSIALCRFDEADAVFQEIIERYPHQPQGYDGYGRVAFFGLANWELALKRWEKAIAKFPENIGFKVRKGNTLINLSRFDRAEAVFQQLIEKHPDMPQGYEGYARLTHSFADWELALKRWSEAILKFPENMGFQLEKGNVLLGLCRFDEANAVFQEIIERYPHQPQGYDGYGRVAFFGLADWELALKRWEKAIAKFPENIGFKVKKGDTLINLSRFDEAEAVFQQLIEKHPDLPQGYEGYARAHSFADWELALKRWENAIAKFPSNIGFQVQKGNVLINLSRFDEAEAVFIGLKEKYPNQHQGYDGYARLTHSVADWELALERWENAIVKFPNNIGFQVQKGNVLINLSRFDKAEAVFIGLKEKYPNQPSGYEGYARVAQSLRDWELALERWENTIVKFPSNIGFRFQKGNNLINLSRFGEAETVFQEIIQQYPGHHHGYYGYGTVAHRWGDSELALDRWEDAIAKLPHYFQFYLLKGYALANLFRYEEAETWWEKVIAQYPYRHEGLSQSAALARRLKNREFAWQRFEQTIEKFPWHLPTYCEAAKELIALGRFAEAEKKFLLALQRNPNDLTVLLQAGILASQQGSRELALERFERAIEFYHPRKAIDAYILAATELKYLGRESEAEAKYEQIVSFHQQRGLYPEVKLLGTSLTSIQELGLLLDRLVTKQPDSIEDVVSLAKLTDKILFNVHIRTYPAPVDKDASSLLPKLKILRELFWQFLATPDDCQDWDLGVADFGYDLYLLAVAKLLNNKFLRLFNFYFHEMTRQLEQYLSVLKHFNMAIQLLEKESQRLNSREWRRVKLVRTEVPLPLTDKLCFEGLSSSARYVMGTDERMPKSQMEARVKYLPGLMDEEKEYLAAIVRKSASTFKSRSRQTIDIFKNFICEPPFGVSDGYTIPWYYYHNVISQEFIHELDHDNADNSGQNIYYAKLDKTYSNKSSLERIYSLDPRGFLEEVAINQKKLLGDYYEDEIVFGISNYANIWSANENYGHVLFDQVPCLILYQKLNLSCPIFIPHITDSHWDIFSHLNIPKEKILVKQEQKFKYLILGRYQLDAEMANFYRNLRESIVVKRRNIPSEYRARYVYISRRYFENRKMANEIEVEELMASLGFSIIYAERFSFEEIAMLMHHASVVVSPYGANLSNTLLCQTGITVVSIYPPTTTIDANVLFLSFFVNYDLYIILGKKIGNSWKVDTGKLKRVITTIVDEIESQNHW